MLLGALVLGACGADSDPAPASTPVPTPSTLDYKVDEPGPFRAGHRVISTSYQPPNGLPERTIKVHLWYPTTDTTGETTKYYSIFAEQAFENATLAPAVEAAGYPVHVHSHGAWGFAGNSSDLMRWMATHGWVAVAPDHAGHTLPENGKGGVPLRMYYLRAADIRASLDAVEKLPATDPLAGKARTDRVSMSGHSFGTNTTWAVLGARVNAATVQKYCDEGGHFAEPCAPGDVDALVDLGDPRVVAGIPMAGAPSEWFAGGFDDMKKPAMQMSAKGDQVGADKIWEAVKAPDFTWVEFEGGCHQLFGFGDCPDYPGTEGFVLVDTYAMAFVRQKVQGDAQPRTTEILGGQASISTKITYHRKETAP